jgi:hypothetical protein
LSDQNVGHVLTHFRAPISIDSTLLSLASISSRLNAFVSILLIPVLLVLHSCTPPSRSYGSHLPAPLSLITISCLQYMKDFVWFTHNCSIVMYIQSYLGIVLAILLYTGVILLTKMMHKSFKDIPDDIHIYKNIFSCTILAGKKVMVEQVTIRAARSGKNPPLIVSIPRSIADKAKLRISDTLLMYTDGDKVIITRPEMPTV